MKCPVGLLASRTTILKILVIDEVMAGVERDALFANAYVDEKTILTAVCADCPTFGIAWCPIRADEQRNCHLVLLTKLGCSVGVNQPKFCRRIGDKAWWGAISRSSDSRNSARAVA